LDTHDSKCQNQANGRFHGNRFSHHIPSQKSEGKYARAKADEAGGPQLPLVISREQSRRLNEDVADDYASTNGKNPRIVLCPFAEELAIGLKPNQDLR